MGVLSGDSITAAMPADAAWRNTKAFAVSLEPRGGSTTGAPTGPVLYAAETPVKKV